MKPSIHAVVNCGVTTSDRNKQHDIPNKRTQMAMKEARILSAAYDARFAKVRSNANKILVFMIDSFREFFRRF